MKHAILAGIGLTTVALFAVPTSWIWQKSDLYMVIRMDDGLIGGTVGPLPYDMTECAKRADRMNTAAATAMARRREDGKPNSRAMRSLTMRCEFHAERPENSWGGTDSEAETLRILPAD